MAGFLHYPEGGSHPSVYAEHPIAKVSSLTGQGDALHDYFSPITQRLHAIMSEQNTPKTDETLASLLKETNLFLASTTRLHIKRYDGWLRDILPLREAPALFFRARIWNLLPQVMEDNPEGVVPQVMMHEQEDLWFALRRFSIGNKAKHAALFDPEGLQNWMLKQAAYPSAFFRTCELAAIDAISHHSSSFSRQMHAQGRRIYTSVADALTWETDTYLVGMIPNGLTKLAMMANQMLLSSAPDQPPFNRIVLPFGAKQREAFSKFQSDPVRRGPQAVANIEGGGESWESAGLPGFILWEAGKLNYVNFGNDFEPLERQSTLSTYFVLEGRSALKYAIDKYDPEAELSVKVRDARTSPELKRYGYEEALRDCHRFDEDGYLDRVSHADMLHQLRTIATLGNFNAQNLQDLDPFVWHHPTEPVDPNAPGYHICDNYGDVSETFRSHQVDDKHGEAFAAIAHAYLGESGLSAITTIRNIVSRLERPSVALWKGRSPPIAAWVEAVAHSELNEGAFDVPLNSPNDDIDLPYGYTTIAGIRALSRKHNSAPGDWGEDALAMFKAASDVWPVFERLWVLVSRVYPECILVNSGRFVPAWMATSDERTNAFYSLVANFFDEVRYPVWWVGGDSSPNFTADDLVRLGIDGPTRDRRIAALNFGVLVDTISSKARSETGNDLANAYRAYVGTWYQRMIKDDVPAADRELETFFAREVDADGLTDEQRANIASGILGLAYEAIHSKGGTQALTRELINNWKERAGRAGGPPVRDPTNGINSRLSFHPSVWKSAEAPRVASVAPADPTQRDRPLPGTEAGFGFARSAMPFAPRRGTPFDPLSTRSGMDVERPVEQDLGSLDELDDSQMFYPFVYHKDSGVFWKTDQGRGEKVMTYYLWHRVQHLRKIAPDQFAKLGTLCMLFSRISIQANMACIAPGVAIPPPDLCFMCLRFAIRQNTQGVIIARGEGAAGGMFWKHLDTLVGVDVKAKEWTSHFEAQIGAAVMEPRAIMFHRDVYPSGGLTGYDTSSVAREWSVEHATFDKSLVVMYTGSEFTRERAQSEANPFPVGGRYDSDYLGTTRFSGEVEAKMDDPDHPPYPGYFFYAALHKFPKLHSMHKWSDVNVHAEMSQRRYHPGIAFMEEHASYSGDRRYDNRHKGTGHTAPWPDDVRRLSEGTQVFYPTEFAN